MPEALSALDIVIPETEPLVSPFRAQYDPSAAEGMPSHVTILYPFAPPSLLTADLLEDLAGFFATRPAFDYRFDSTGRFPGVLYLAPEPEACFHELIERTATRFPDYPPYEGLFEEIVPHLTVAHSGNGETLNSIAADFDAISDGVLPIAGRAAEIVLHENSSGRWLPHARFALGSPAV